MDANRFESLLRSFSVAPSRREAVRLLGGLAIGLLGWSGVAQTTAHNAIHECTGIKKEPQEAAAVQGARPQAQCPARWCRPGSAAVSSSGSDLHGRGQERQRERRRLRWQLPALRQRPDVCQPGRLCQCAVRQRCVQDLQPGQR
jgi:hypothetical protein